MLRRTFLVLLALVTLAPGAGAQDLAQTVARGATLRAHLAERTVEGAFVRQSGSTLLLRSGEGELAIDATTVERLELLRERRGHALEGFWIGAGAGAVAGAVIGAAEGPSRDDAREWFAISGAFLLGATGGLLGMLVGSQIGKDRWMDLPRDTYLSGSIGSDGLRFGASVRW
jgi:hypothetical protein